MDNYRNAKIIGTGKYGNVYSCIDNITQNKIAAKVMSKRKLKSSGMIKQIYTEIEILKCLDHPKLIKYVDNFETDNRIYIITEYICDNDLHDILRIKRKFSQPRTKKIISQIVEALIYLHHNNIIHRDIKLENILIDDKDNITLCDFGWSVQTTDPQIQIAGTISYLAPEIINEQPHGKEVDIWSLGILTYEILVGNGPYESRSDDHVHIVDKIKEHDIRYPSTLSEDAINFMKDLLAFNPHDRPTAAQIMNHEWLN